MFRDTLYVFVANRLKKLPIKFLIYRRVPDTGRRNKIIFIGFYTTAVWNTVWAKTQSLWCIIVLQVGRVATPGVVFKLITSETRESSNKICNGAVPVRWRASYNGHARARSHGWHIMQPARNVADTTINTMHHKSHWYDSRRKTSIAVSETRPEASFVTITTSITSSLMMRHAVFTTLDGMS